jgi:hypothetical protein
MAVRCVQDSTAGSVRNRGKILGLLTAGYQKEDAVSGTSSRITTEG